MSTASSFSAISQQGPVLATIGTFDGVHRGHRYLLEQAAARAREHGYSLVVITFDPCPTVVLRPQVQRYQLTTAAQKLRLLAEIDPALIVLLTFTPDLARLTADQFLDAMEGRLQLREIWMGEDFRFGHGREGGLELLVQRGSRDGFSVHVVERRLEERTTISSSRVRELLAVGDVVGVLPLLGRPFALELERDPTRAAPTASGVFSRQVQIPLYLAQPGPGAYAALVTPSDRSKHNVPALVRVSTDVRAPLDITATEAIPESGSVEFIEGFGPASTRDLLERAVQRAQAWRRPVYAASRAG
jgi:riboflavin kinase/FMN adenylyltransferase